MLSKACDLRMPPLDEDPGAPLSLDPCRPRGVELRADCALSAREEKRPCMGESGMCVRERSGRYRADVLQQQHFMRPGLLVEALSL